MPSVQWKARGANFNRALVATGEKEDAPQEALASRMKRHMWLVPHNRPPRRGLSHSHAAKSKRSTGNHHHARPNRSPSRVRHAGSRKQCAMRRGAEPCRPSDVQAAPARCRRWVGPVDSAVRLPSWNGRNASLQLWASLRRAEGCWQRRGSGADRGAPSPAISLQPRPVSEAGAVVLIGRGDAGRLRYGAVKKIAVVVLAGSEAYQHPQNLGLPRRADAQKEAAN